MKTWQAVIATATQSPLSMGQLRSGAEPTFGAGSSSNTPAFVSILRPLTAHAVTAWKWLEHKRTQQLATRRLKVAETISLGEKRFVSILQVDGAQFLIGGAAGNVSLLAILNQKDDVNTDAVSQAIASVEGSR